MILDKISREERTMTQQDQMVRTRLQLPQPNTQQSPILPQTDDLLRFILDPEHAMILCIFEIRITYKKIHTVLTVCKNYRSLRTLKQKDEDFVVTDLTLKQKGDRKFWQDGLFIVSPHHVQIREIKRRLKSTRTVCRTICRHS